MAISNQSVVPNQRYECHLGIQRVERSETRQGYSVVGAFLKHAYHNFKVLCKPKKIIFE